MNGPDLEPQSLVWIAKLTGAVAGSAISLAYLLPRGKREAAIRFLTGVAGGLVFGTTVGVTAAKKLDIDTVLTGAETILMGSALASLTIWWVLGFALRFADAQFGRGAGRKTAERKDDNEC